MSTFLQFSFPLTFSEKKQHNTIKTKIDAWLTFFTTDIPEEIIHLITDYPEFRPLYEEIYQMCLNTEKVMEMFSKELLELDRNTVQYMIDEMQDTIVSQKDTIDDLQNEKSYYPNHYRKPCSSQNILYKMYPCHHP